MALAEFIDMTHLPSYALKTMSKIECMRRVCEQCLSVGLRNLYMAEECMYFERTAGPYTRLLSPLCILYAKTHYSPAIKAIKWYLLDHHKYNDMLARLRLRLVNRNAITTRVGK